MFLSVIYGLLVAGVFALDFPSSVAYHEREVVAAMSQDAQDIVAGVPQKARSASLKPWEQEWNSIGLTLEIADGQNISVPRNSSKEEINLVGREYVRVAPTVLTTLRMEHILVALAVWLVPALTACLLGLAVAWVRRGFRGPQP